MEIYLIRHPAVNIEAGICYGNTDVGVSEDILRSTVEKVKTNIPDYSGLTFYSSDLTRCKLLAERLSKNDIIYSAELRELNFGKWEMQRWNEIPETELKYWMEDFVDRNCEAGESYQELDTRVINYWNELVEKNHDKIAVITHGGVIRSILCNLLGMPLKNSFRIKIDYSSISKVVINNDMQTVEFVNK
jgi:alpha-ribazole phosphatase